MDSLDWPEEYHLRFGPLHVDFATQRTPKASFGWHLDLTRLVRNLFDCRGGLRDLVQARELVIRAVLAGPGDPANDPIPEGPSGVARR